MMGNVIHVIREAAQHKGNAMWIFYALLSAVFAALVSLLVKLGLQKLDSDVGTMVRTAVVLIFTIGLLMVRQKTSLVTTITAREFALLAASGVATALSWLFYYRALQMGTLSTVAALDKASLPIAILLGVIFLKEQLSVKDILAAILITSGTLLFVFK